MKIDWKTVLIRLRTIIIISIFCLLYHFIHPIASFAYIFYIIINDIADIEDRVIVQNKEFKEIKEIWTSILSIRKPF